MSKRGATVGAIIGVLSLVVGGFAIFIGLLSGAQGGSGAKASGGTTIIVGGIVVALIAIWWTRGADDSSKNE